jgi:hypothetical protein
LSSEQSRNADAPRVEVLPSGTKLTDAFSRRNNSSFSRNTHFRLIPQIPDETSPVGTNRKIARKSEKAIGRMGGDNICRFWTRSRQTRNLLNVGWEADRLKPTPRKGKFAESRKWAVGVEGQILEMSATFETMSRNDFN